MAIPLLISKKDIPNTPIFKFFKEDYRIGYLYIDETKGYWSIWGSCENLDKAIKCVKDFIREKGYRDVYLSNDYLKDINLTLDQIKSFKKLNIEEW